MSSPFYRQGMDTKRVWPPSTVQRYLRSEATRNEIVALRWLFSLYSIMWTYQRSWLVHNHMGPLGWSWGLNSSGLPSPRLAPYTLPHLSATLVTFGKTISTQFNKRDKLLGGKCFKPHNIFTWGNKAFTNPRMILLPHASTRKSLYPNVAPAKTLWQQLLFSSFFSDAVLLLVFPHPWDTWVSGHCHNPDW